MMSLSREEYTAYVNQLEQSARAFPAFFYARVVGIVVLGLLSIPLLLILIVFFAALTLLSFSGVLVNTLRAGRSLYALIFQAAVAIRSLGLEIPPPEGIPVSRTRVPKLYALVDKLVKTFHAPQVHRIILTGECTAAMCQTPRLGLLGWQQNDLVIGLPLLQSLSRDHLRSIIGHELAHLSGQHGRFTQWLHRMYRMGMHLMEMLSYNRKARTGLYQFFKWYLPLLGPYAFVLSRLHEIQADRRSAALTGMENMAEALLRVRLIGTFLNSVFWPRVWSMAETHAIPPRRPLAGLLATLRRGIPPAFMQDALQQALAEKSDLRDPHPGLPDRLAWLGFRPRVVDGQPALPETLSLPKPPKTTAAEELLDDTLDSAVLQLDEGWWIGALGAWKQQYINAEPSRRSKLHTVTQNLLAHGYRSSTAIDAEKQVLVQLLRILTENPKDLSAHQRLGDLLLEQGDDAGIQHLNFVIEHDFNYAIPACEKVHAYLVSTGRTVEADYYAERAKRHAVLLRQAEEERRQLTPQSLLVPHDWTPEELQRLYRHLESNSDIFYAFLVRKEVSLLPEKSCYLLVLVPDTTSITSRTSGATLIERFRRNILFPHETMIVTPTEPYLWLEKRLKNIEGALIYRRLQRYY